MEVKSKKHHQEKKKFSAATTYQFNVLMNLNNKKININWHYAKHLVLAYGKY